MFILVLYSTVTTTFHKYNLDQGQMSAYTASIPLPTMANRMISPVTTCSLMCNHKRADVSDVTACNSFYVDGDQCHLGYMEPQWIMEAVLESADASPGVFLYTDFENPI